MSLRSITLCDFYPYVCPYDAEGHADCEYWCGASEPDDDPDPDQEDDNEN